MLGHPDVREVARDLQETGHLRPAANGHVSRNQPRMEGLQHGDVDP
jgi:hypothetical protein